MSEFSRITEIRKGGSVRRYHTQRMINYQTVADHSWGVMQILLEICEPSPDLMRAALYHDVAEHWTGDIPATAKWNNQEFERILQAVEKRIEFDLEILVILSLEEQKLLKIADLLELVFHCHEEYVMGNGHVLYIIHNGVNALRHKIMEGDKAMSVLKEFINIYQRDTDHA